jgi:SpoVK/Ycf46/Vps4 family AAA+-type ATPase
MSGSWYNNVTYLAVSEDLGTVGIAKARQTLRNSVVLPSLGIAAEDAYVWWEEARAQRIASGHGLFESDDFMVILPPLVGFPPGVGGHSRYKFAVLAFELLRRDFDEVDTLMHGDDELLELPDEVVSQWNPMVAGVKASLDWILLALADLQTQIKRSLSSRRKKPGENLDLSFLTDFIHTTRNLIIYADWFREQKTRDDSAAQLWNALTDCLKAIQNPTSSGSPAISARTTPESQPGSEKKSKKPKPTKPSDEQTGLNTHEIDERSPFTSPQAASSVEDVKEILAEIDALAGHANIKAKIRELVDTWEINVQRRDVGLPVMSNIGHFVFLGNPGTGKTTVARLLGDLLSAMGVLSRGTVVECGRADLVGEYVGQTAVKTRQVLEGASGGVLFIDEAYTLDGASEQDFGLEAIGEILKFMEDNRGDFVVIAAGYREEMRRFLESNPGLPSRFTTTFDFEDLPTDSLLDVFKSMASEHGLKLMAGVDAAVIENVEVARKRPNFDNARFIRTLFESCMRIQSARLTLSANRSKADLESLQKEDIPPARPSKSSDQLDKVMEDLDELIGLENVKQRVKSLISKVQVDELRRNAGLAVSDFAPHLIFSGGPGTGKTTVARLIGRAFAQLGILRSGHVIETDRSGLVAGYVGKTAIQTTAVCESARDGVLFIDEAYSLIDSGQHAFGQEAIETIMKFMEDNRGQISVIAAGYPNEMAQFLAANPGLPRRFDLEIVFPDYSLQELMQIATADLKRRGYVFGPGAEDALESLLEAKKGAPKFGNAGEVRKLLDKSILNQTSRIVALGATDEESLQLITAEDIAGS